jgi:hypothetical protein
MVCPTCHTESGPSLFCYVCDPYLPPTSHGLKAGIPSRLGAFLLDGLFLLGVLVAVGAVNSELPGQEATAVRVPFVGCASDGQNGPVPAPKGQERVMSIDAREAQGLAYYAATFSGVLTTNSVVLAPRGWYCFGLYGSSGSTLLVTPQPIKSNELLSAAQRRFTGPVIGSSCISGITSGRFTVARIIARIFPAQAAFVQGVIREGVEPASDFPFGPYPKDKLTFQSDRIVEYQTPPRSEGLGTDCGWLKANDSPINGAAILQGGTPDLAILNVRLPSGASHL